LAEERSSPWYHDRRERQHRQRLAAAARECTIEHLKHVQRRDEQQHIDRQAEQRGVSEE
jgi:hypothetical protein